MQLPAGNVVDRPLDASQARMLEHASPVALIIADVDGDRFSVLAASAVLRRFITGAKHPAGPVPGELIGPEGFGALSPVMAAVLADGGQHTTELGVGDEPRWHEVVATPVVVDGTCRQVIVMAVDRAAEHEIERGQRRGRARFEAMVTNAPGLVLLVDSSGRILFASPSVERLLGRDVADVTGRPIFELLHPDTLARSASVFGQVLSSPGEAIRIRDFRMNRVDAGLLWCEATITNLLHDDDVAAVVVNAFDITDRRLAEERLELVASTDALTGLANRRQLERHLDAGFDQAVKRGGRVGMALLDVDEFKLVNDGLGHEVGDRVLRILANRLEGVVADRGVVARIGGDEFAVTIDEMVEDDELERLSEAMHDSLRSPCSVAGHEVYVGASIGTSWARPPASDAQALLRSADLALFRAKRNGRNQTVGFTAELQLQAEQRLETVTALQRALREGHLRLAYQPIVDAGGRLVGAEALLRWDHDGRLMTPDAFLGTAEDTGLIMPMGAWVLDQACGDLAALRHAAGGPEIWVSVNLSSRQVLDERLPLAVRDTLDRYGLGPGALVVEVDEATLGVDPNIHSVLAGLTHARVALAMSDAGRDQSALRLLGRGVIDLVKLDRAFIRDVELEPTSDVRTIGAAIMDLTARAGVDVVAQGIETEAQQRAAHDLGCPFAQGFQISRPLDLASLILFARASLRSRA